MALAGHEFSKSIQVGEELLNDPQITQNQRDFQNQRFNEIGDCLFGGQPPRQETAQHYFDRRELYANLAAYAVNPPPPGWDWCIPLDDPQNLPETPLYAVYKTFLASALNGGINCQLYSHNGRHIIVNGQYVVTAIYVANGNDPPQPRPNF